MLASAARTTNGRSSFFASRTASRAALAACDLAKPMFASALDGLPLEYSHLGERAISWTR